jgi:hypothetical protein
MPNLPYYFWTRQELFKHCERQCEKYGCSDLIAEFKEIIFDERWNPIEEYNGCNLIQDKHHPYPPCLKHDFDWLVLGGGYKTDVEFRLNLKRFGTSKKKSVLMFLGVRAGWFFYFKWEKMFKRFKKRKKE